jgi:hypothetical protein
MLPRFFHGMVGIAPRVMPMPMKPVDVAMTQQGVLNAEDNSLNGQNLNSVSNNHPRPWRFDVSVKNFT